MAPESNRGDVIVRSSSGPTELPPQFGRYRVKQKLGGGGMGTVYLVENTELEREEALKVPHFMDGEDTQIRERFLREAKSAARLEHANLCPVYDAGVLDGIYYLTMRFLKGKLLLEYAGNVVPARKAVEIVTKLAQALEAAHGKGVIHRDLKPANIMMVGGVGPVVMDFGLAKLVRQPDQTLTLAGATLGTPAYMPPEQVHGDLEQMGPASDIYSLGVILYELLTGRRPFESKTVAIYGQILYTEPPLPSTLVLGLSSALDDICRKAMAKAPSDRYPSMKAFASVLKDFLREMPAPATAGVSNPASGSARDAGIFETPTLAPGAQPVDKATIFQTPTIAPGPTPGSTPFASSRFVEGANQSQSNPDSLPPGLANHPDYDSLRELGHGGMGVVYLGHNRLMDRDEVLKVLSPQLMDRHGIEERFLREIRAVAKLRHQNIVAAYSAFRLGESIVFAMEYVKGLDLSKLVKAKGPLPVGHACHFMQQAAQGLQHAFEEGMVHRDIKPGNLMLSRRGDSALIKILDFGLAKAAREEVADTGLTHAGQMLGTPDYVAPEQIRNAQGADVRADIYSLGCTLYYLLTGGPPFQAASLYDLLQAHHSMYAKPLNLLRPEVPSELAALVAKMMAKEPEQRFQTPSEVAEALKPFEKKGGAAFKRTHSEPSRNGSSDFDGSETYSLAEMPSRPDTNKAETVFASPSRLGKPIRVGPDNPERSKNPRPDPSGGDGGSPPWGSWLLIAAGFFSFLILLGLIIHIVIDKKKATVTIERTPDTDPGRPERRVGASLFNGENLTGWTKVENGSNWAVENGLLVGRGGGPGKPAVLVTDRRDFTNYRLHARLRYPQVGHGWIELRRTGENTKTDCYFVYVGIDSGRPPMGSLGKGRGFIYGTPYPVQAVATVSPRLTERWYDLDVEVLNNSMTCSVDGNRVSAYADLEGAFPSGAIAVAGSGVSVIQFEKLSIEELRPVEPPPVPVTAPPMGDNREPSENRQVERRLPQLNPPTPSDAAAIRGADIDRGQSLVASTDPAEIVQIVGAVAPGFTVKTPVIPGGVAIVAEHFGRKAVLSTHPRDAVQPCILTSTIEVPADKKTSLSFDVSHSAAGDWQLIVLANGEPLYDAPVGPTTARGGWQSVSVDLTRFAGKPVILELLNKATGYSHEWGFWDNFKITSVEVTRKPNGSPSAPPEVDRARPEALDCTSPNGVGTDLVQRTQTEWAKFLGRKVEENVAIGDGVTMTFELSPPGKFWMGSPPNEHGKGGRYPNEVLHEVTLTEPFDVSKFEVTQAQYMAITGKRVSLYDGPDRPVEQVTWNEASDFGKLLTRKLSDGHEYRLLTEAEWEYSCRGGRPSSLPFGVGDGRTLTPRDANFDNHVGQTSRVGSYAPNALGLYDTHGNVWEWCADWNEPYPDGPATNPFRAVGGPFRVARGGCHNEPAPECRAALRQGSPEGRRDCWMGFRLARSLPPVR